MFQVVYTTKHESIEKFIVIQKLDELLSFIQFNKLSLLSIPANEEGFDIADFILTNKIQIDTIHIYGELLNKLKIFFYLAKEYQELGFKKNIIFKHEYLDGMLK